MKSRKIENLYDVNTAASWFLKMYSFIEGILYIIYYFYFKERSLLWDGLYLLSP